MYPSHDQWQKSKPKARGSLTPMGSCKIVTSSIISTHTFVPAATSLELSGRTRTETLTFSVEDDGLRMVAARLSEDAIVLRCCLHNTQRIQVLVTPSSAATNTQSN
eukprot:m.53640 g.53640  ORF g.53640 m.53640 type:complete len:106 (-) comp11374_c1_seq2:204-521(-)